MLQPHYHFKKLHLLLLLFKILVSCKSFSSREETAFLWNPQSKKYEVKSYRSELERTLVRYLLPILNEDEQAWNNFFKSQNLILKEKYAFKDLKEIKIFWSLKLKHKKKLIKEDNVSQNFLLKIKSIKPQDTKLPLFLPCYNLDLVNRDNKSVLSTQIGLLQSFNGKVFVIIP